MTAAAPRCRYFPHEAAGFAVALADGPVLLDGLRVVLDEKVALVPVTLEEPGEGEEDDELAR